MRPSPAEVVRAVCGTLAADVVEAITDPFVRTQVQVMIPALANAAMAWDGEADRLRDGVRQLDSFLDRAASELAAVAPAGATDPTDREVLCARLAERGAVDPDAEPGLATLQARRLAARELLTYLLVVCERVRDDGDLVALRTEAYGLAAST